MAKTRKKNKNGVAKPKAATSENSADKGLLGDVKSFWNDLTTSNGDGKGGKKNAKKGGAPPKNEQSDPNAFGNRKRQRASQQERPMVTPDVQLTTGVGLPTSLPTIPAGKMKGTYCQDKPWYEQLESLTTATNEVAKKKTGEEDDLIVKHVPKFVVDKKRAEAIAYYEQEMEAYESKQSKREEQDADLRWTKKVLSSGTLSDKVAAMALMVADDPFHQLRTLDHLLSMARKKGRREAGMAVEALKDLFLNTLLPDRRLVRFTQRVTKVAKVAPELLVLWHFEDELKCRYIDFVRAVEAASFDNLEYFKRSMIKTLYELLLEKPELEQLLLTSLVNKLGDPEKKIASQVVYFMNNLVQKHPNMRPVVAKEVEQFLHRPNLADRAVYYGVIFLNQIVLRKDDDEKFARHLISIYLGLFKDLCLNRNINDTSASTSTSVTPVKSNGKGSKKKKGSKSKSTPKPSAIIESKLLSALLTGVNRAFPYANSTGDEFNEQVDALFKMVHIGTFATSTQALMLLLQVMNARKAVSDRFYKALYAKLLSTELFESSKQTLFLNVLFKSMKSDVILHRQRAFVKRLLQVAVNAPAQLAAGCLFLLSALVQNTPALAGMIHQPRATTTKQPEKRLNDKLQSVKQQMDDDLSSDEEDEVEKKVEAESSDDDEQLESSTNDEHKDEAEDDENESSKVSNVVVDEYDCAVRDPLYAKATESTLAWELGALSKHYHPSVQAFANELLENPLCKIEYSGDPLKDFSTTAFLDRFMYRNPKKNVEDSLKKVSVFGREGRGSRVGRHVLTASAVNSAKFAALDISEVRDNEKFFYRYFQDKMEREGVDSLAKESKPKNNDVFESDSEEEAFAQSLAEKLMRDHGDGKGADDHDVDDIDFGYSSDEEEGKKSKKKKTEQKNVPEEGEDSEEEWGSDGEDDQKIEDAAESMLFGDDESSDDEEVPDFDGDEVSDVDEEDSDDEGAKSFSKYSAGMQKKLKAVRSKKSKSASMFAAAEEFAEVLETAGDDGVDSRQAEWEDRNTTDGGSSKNKKRKGGSAKGRKSKKRR